MSMKKQVLIAGGGSFGSAIAAMSLMSTMTKKEDVVLVDDNPFENPPIPITNPYAGLPEWKYTPTFNSGKSRKCSNKKYHKRKKS
jgi:hypothetical protein